ncbi:folate-binding protein [Pusillimonas sp. TS35]|uniref:CAF17-like 4Fe-4S cluster assembly/insertion protein YgfZ n=1 Tax=Paracandidimonas lactea TaxID=2895524 RepID=UPI00136F713C|nr:folate-binding protein YgfZ [Paracandidimonas lactea]MYN12174.1 folate-binding protein [Pusillimonas sp. TS35]
MNNSPASLLPLPDIAVVQATGSEAIAFLHGQLTQDIQGLPGGQARLAGYCTPKGRLLGSLVIWKAPVAAQGEDDPVAYALVKSDIAAALTKRIAMFILRAKAKLQVTRLRVSGLTVAPTAQQPAGLPAQPNAWSVAQSEGATYICAPTAGNSAVRWWVITQEHNGAPGEAAEPAAGMHAQWQAADIAAGLPWIQAATQDLFIPQTLNFDLIGGVNFTKGCYPGQEVVARAHYRGTVKRRMAYGVANDASGADPSALPGVDTFDARQPDSPAGRIINAARADDTLHLLMEVQLSDLDDAQYRLGAADGPAIQLVTLPYSITAEG